MGLNRHLRLSSLRILYTILFYLALPVIALRLYWRGIKAPAYRLRWRERFGCYQQPYPQGVIWLHAVSVGEAEAVFPLVRQLQDQHPNIPILITTTTPTGSARVTAVLQDSVSHVYLPYDVPDAVARFMRCFKPRLAVMMETEIWPNLFFYCGKHAIPLYIINARLSEKSARGYQKIASLARPVINQTRLIATQTNEDRLRFIAIGAKPDKVKTLGNIKFALDIPETTLQQGRQLKAECFSGRFVWLLASSHLGEESLFIDFYQSLKSAIPELLLIIAPRHPERFADVLKLYQQQQLTVVTRTSGVAVTSATDVYLADTMGELKMLYAAADVAFVGGSLIPRGGHNVLEAAAVGTPVMFGPHMFNFKEIARNILSHQAAVQCLNNNDVSQILLALYQHPEQRATLSRNGLAFIRQNQGAIDSIAAMLNAAISVPEQAQT